MDRLQEFFDYKEIIEKLGLWCRIVDQRTLDRMGEVFAQDLVWDFGGGTVDNGLAAIVARIQAHLVEATLCRATHHHIANPWVEINGDTAESEANFLSVAVGHPGAAERALIEMGNYHDFWQRTEQGWRIVKRLYRMDIQDGPMEIMYGSAPAEMWEEGDARRLNR